MMTFDEQIAAQAAADRAVSRVMRGNSNPTIEREDLQQEAQLVLLKLFDDYNVEKGKVFSYVFAAITRHLINFVHDQAVVVYKHRRGKVLMHRLSLDALEFEPCDVVDITGSTNIKDPHQHLALRHLVRYVTEIAGQPITAYLMGRLSLDDVQAETGWSRNQVEYVIKRTKKLVTNNPQFSECTL